ncbi:GNAT family N-acetyltransferase [Allorhizocola rhizosphaerae]|uniref:GNAT family N-acetyltransferase n=1 Tax=Allorhizocola rhizosphaerae TaxID=1872709 RepID=UPI000E3D8045|nr:GNAT family N-acetyltransferase [Allorhizocola rhizosphaerae]
MLIRPYTDADLPALQATFAGWIAQAGRCGYDHIGELPHRIYENLRGRGAVQMFLDRDSIVGLAICGRSGDAFDVFTAPALRGTRFEEQMIAAVPSEFVLTDAWDCDSARIELLGRLGFERFRVWDDVRELSLTEPVAAIAGVRGARFDDAERLAEAHNSAFGDDWTGERYLNEVMRKPGYDPAREIVVEAPDGRIAAFAVMWLDERNRTGHFEPVGTHADFRRRGHARAVMLHAMHLMREAGMTLVTVNHNAENVAALQLYESLGFARTHETYGFRRPPAG